MSVWISQTVQEQANLGGVNLAYNRMHSRAIASTIFVTTVPSQSQNVWHSAKGARFLVRAQHGDVILLCAHPRDRSQSAKGRKAELFPCVRIGQTGEPVAGLTVAWHHTCPLLPTFAVSLFLSPGFFGIWGCFKACHSPRSRRRTKTGDLLGHPASEKQHTGTKLRVMSDQGINYMRILARLFSQPVPEDSETQPR